MGATIKPEKYHSLIYDKLTKPAYKMRELQQLASRSRSGIYKEVKEGRLRMCKMGKSSYFLADDIAEWLLGMRV